MSGREQTVHFSKYLVKLSCGFLILLLTSCSFMDTAPEPPPEALTQEQREDLKKPAHLQDLAYGEILYDYYRGEEISALTKILIAQKENQIPHHKHSAELLSGVIYLNLGMVIKAQGIFNQLLTEEDLKNELLAKLEFYLAKLHYKQQDYPQAKMRLLRVYESIDVRLQDECFIMLSNIALFDEQLPEARDWLNKVSENSELLVYTRYNLGILWLKSGQLDQALPLLTKIFLSENPSDTQRSLQDKAKVALGFFYLKNKQLEKAREQFLAVRLGSPYTNKALLGMGWTYVEKGDYNKALSHWLELRTKDIRDIAVQEALVAIPYAYQKLKAMQPALEKYLEASVQYQKQIDLINDIEHQVTEGQLVENLVAKMIEAKQFGEEDKIIQDSKLFQEDYDYYIYELLAQNSFNENFRSYQKLERLELLLIHWQNELPMLNEMLRTNQLRFDKKIPKVDFYLKQGSFEKYQALYNLVQEDLASLEKHEKLYLLADEDQTALHKRIVRLENNLKKIPPSMLTDDQVDKARRARGVLQWQLEESLTEKTWELKKTSNEIEKKLAEMSNLSSNLSTARENALTRFVGYQEQVDEGSLILIELRRRIKSQVERESGIIKEQILAVLRKRKATLELFLLQSDLSVARLHEQAVFIPEVN